MSVLDSFSLQGKVAVITGGGGLYGRQMVRALAEAGATVYTVSRHPEANEKCASALRDEGYSVYAGILDQSDEKSVRSFLDGLIKEGKKVDILVNNAVLRPMKSYDADVECFSESMRVNAT